LRLHNTRHKEFFPPPNSIFNPSRGISWGAPDFFSASIMAPIRMSGFCEVRISCGIENSSKVSFGRGECRKMYDFYMKTNFIFNEAWNSLFLIIHRKPEFLGPP